MDLLSLILGLTLMFFTEPEFLGSWDGVADWQNRSDLRAHVLTAVPFARGVVLVVWCAGVWLTVIASCLTLSVLFKNRMLASALPAVLAAAVVFGIPLTAVTLDALSGEFGWPLLDDLEGVVFPPFTLLRYSSVRGVQLGAVVGATVWWSAAGVALFVATQTVKRFAAMRA